MEASEQIKNLKNLVIRLENDLAISNTQREGYKEELEKLTNLLKDKIKQAEFSIEGMRLAYNEEGMDHYETRKAAFQEVLDALIK